MFGVSHERFRRVVVRRYGDGCHPSGYAPGLDRDGGRRSRSQQQQQRPAAASAAFASAAIVSAASAAVPPPSRPVWLPICVSLL